MTTRSWIRTLFARTPRTARKAPARRLAVEALEGRALPATLSPVADTAAEVPKSAAVGINDGGKPAVIAIAGDQVKVAAVTPTPTAPDSLDKLRIPTPVPDDWYALNGINVPDADKQAALLLEVTKPISAVPGYVSSAALWNRIDLLTKQMHDEGGTFNVTVDGQVVTVSVPASNTSTAGSLKQQILDSLHAGVPPAVAKQLSSVIGPPAAPPTKSAEVVVAQPPASDLKGESTHAVKTKAEAVAVQPASKSMGAA